MLLDADKLRIDYHNRLRTYVDSYFTMIFHANKLYAVIGQSTLKLDLREAPELIFMHMLDQHLTRMTEHYRGETENILRYSELATRFSKVSTLVLDRKRIESNKDYALADFDLLADTLRFDLVVNEINSKAMSLEFDGKVQIANRIIQELSLEDYQGRGTPKTNIKRQSRHITISGTIYRDSWSKTFNYASNKDLRVLHRYLGIVANETGDKSIVPALDEMKIGEFEYEGDMGSAYGNKTENHIKLFKESIRFCFTHGSYEQLMVWLLTYSNKKIASLPETATA